ncbi:MAG: class I SAM-dependent methyltransferase [Halomonadaceae bacterium]|nr:MAG: class I SAM-dependent methyltransferase [Halomonadaceae bacterium]
MHDKYRLIGPVYELLSFIYSGRNIHHCKNAMLKRRHIRPGDQVLVAGVGHGYDAIAAARLGARVTVVDISATMLAQFRRTLAKEAPGLIIKTLHQDILQVDHQEQYDMVIANFFLNVFDQSTMEKMLAHLVNMGRPGASVVIGDFSYPSGNPVAKAFKQSYWMLAALVFWLLANNALHRIYNYPQQLEKLGLRVREKRHFRLLGMNCYWSILAQKPGTGEQSPPGVAEASLVEEPQQESAQGTGAAAAPMDKPQPAPVTASGSASPVTRHSSVTD